MKPAQLLPKLTFPTLAFLILITGSLIAVYYPLSVHIKQTPVGTVYTYAEGYLPDYYQYLGWVKDGMMGRFLVSSRYTEVQYPPALVHSLFPVTGMVGGFLGLPSYTSYTLLRFLSNIVFIIVFAIVAGKFLKNGLMRGLSYLFLLAITGVWMLDRSGKLIEAVSWNGNFNIVGKFFLPPHHLLSLSFLLLGVVRFIEFKNRRDLTAAVLLMLAGGLMNPSLLLFFLLFLALSVPLRPSFLPGLKKSVPYLLIFFGVLSAALLYNSFLFRTTMPWSRMYTLMRGFNPPVTFLSYLYGLGPVLIPAFIALTSPKIRQTQFGMFLFLWGFLPLVLFHFLGRPLPMNASRLFQSYQFIPLAILASVGTVQIAESVRKFKIPPAFLAMGISAGFLVYGLTPFTKGMEQIIEPVKPWYFNEYVPANALHAFAVLDTKTPPESVVVASEAVSTMIPAFTHNRVLLGRDDVAPDYYEKRDKAFAMLDGRYNESDAREFLKTYRVSYILFGLDAHRFADTSNPELPFLKEIYKDGDISLVAVTE